MSTTIKNLFKSSGRYIGTVASVITIGEFVNNRSLKVQYEAELNKNRELENKITELLENKITDDENKSKILELVNRRSNSIDIVRNDVNKIQELELNTNLAKPDLNDDTKEIISNQLSEQVNKLTGDMGKVNNDLSDIIDLVTKTSSKY
jgi:hypothetical protein